MQNNNNEETATIVAILTAIECNSALTVHGKN